MLPNPQAGSQASPGGEVGGQGGQPSPEEVRQMILQVIGEAKKIAAQYGIDFNSLISSPEQSGGAVPPPPRPPSPAF